VVKKNVKKRRKEKRKKFKYLMLIYNMSRKEIGVFVRIDKNLMNRIIAYCRDNGIDVNKLGYACVIRGIIARFLKEKGYQFAEPFGNEANKNNGGD